MTGRVVAEKGTKGRKGEPGRRVEGRWGSEGGRMEERWRCSNAPTESRAPVVRAVFPRRGELKISHHARRNSCEKRTKFFAASESGR